MMYKLPDEIVSNGRGAITYLVSIQYARALAAMLVVVFHVSMINPGGDWEFYRGQTGVDIFFVISGLVMWMTGRNLTPADFLKRRISRIVPLYWAVTLFVAFVAIRGGLKISLEVAPLDLVRSLFFIAYDKGYGAIRVSPIVEPGWTLNLEMMFYALFALCLPLRKNLFWAMAALLIAITSLSFLFEPGERVARFYTHNIILEFLLGMVLGKLLGERGRPGKWLTIALLSFGTAWMIMGGAGTHLRIFDFGIGAFLLVAGVVGLEPLLRRHPVPLMKLLGDASYSIYLTHVLSLGLFVKLAAKFGFAGTMLSDLLMIALCAAAGCAVYLLFEKPVGRLMKPLTR